MYRRYFYCLLIIVGLCSCGQSAPPALLIATDRQGVPVPSTVPITATVYLTPTAHIAPTPERAVQETPSAEPRPQSLPMPSIVGYAAYRVHEGDTVEDISMRGGSDPELLMRYNRLTAPPQPGRELLVPRLSGYTSELTGTRMLITRGDTSKRWVALTFDGGGNNAYTDKLLDILRDAHVHVTFFVLGDSIMLRPDLLQRMVREGHELGNHSYHHPDFRTLTPAQMRRELERTELVVQKAIGDSATTRPYVRLPYGSHNRQVVETMIAAGYIPIQWSIDSYDSHGKPLTSVEIANKVNTQLTEKKVPGAIVLLHCTEASVNAIPTLLKLLKARDIEVHTLTEVLGP